MVMFLIGLENPSADIINAVHDVAAWYETTRITGKIWVRGEADLKEDAKAQMQSAPQCPGNSGQRAS